MITRVEYESEDRQRSAIVSRIRELEWFVILAERHDRGTRSYTKTKRTLTSAQSAARVWVAGGAA